MDIQTLVRQSGDSQLVEYSFSEGRLVVVLRVPELSESTVCVEVPTDRVFASVPADESAPHRTCFVELADVEQYVDVNGDGIIVPASNFVSFMRQVRDGLALTYGLRLGDCPLLLRFRGARPLVACTVRDQKDIQCLTRVEKGS